MGAWSKLAGDLSNWYAQPWVAVDVPIMWSVAQYLGPGAVILFSSLFAPTREGVYGNSNKLARVISMTLNLNELTAEVRVLVQPGDATKRRWAPVAMVLDDVSTVEQRHDAAHETMFCYADAFGHGEGTHDLAWFVEPAWSSIGGEARVQGWQHDGRRWEATFSLTVVSVDTTADSLTYSKLEGTFYEARPTILVLAPWAEQSPGSWPCALFSVVTRSDTKFGGVPTQGYPLL
jgi:hypothetical protein